TLAVHRDVAAEPGLVRHVRVGRRLRGAELAGRLGALPHAEALAPAGLRRSLADRERRERAVGDDRVRRDLRALGKIAAEHRLLVDAVIALPRSARIEGDAR